MATRTELTNYVKRRLGYPINHLEISDDQFTDVIDQTLNHFYYYGTGASTKEAYLALAIKEDTNEYSISDDVMGVALFLPDEDAVQGVNTLFTVENYLYNTGQLDFILKSAPMSLVSYQLAMQHVALSNTMLRKQYTIEVNESEHKLIITPTPTTDMSAMVKCYTKIAEQYILDHMWVKKYAIVLAKLQWYTNTNKFGGITLPGGATYNTREFADKAEAEKIALEEELRTSFEEPPLFFTG